MCAAVDHIYLWGPARYSSNLVVVIREDIYNVLDFPEDWFWLEGWFLGYDDIAVLQHYITKNRDMINSRNKKPVLGVLVRAGC